MSDKKSDGFYAQGAAREADDSQAEKERFIPGPSTQSFSGQASNNFGLGNSFSKLDNSPGISVMAYCLASISMTVVNKYVVSGAEWNLTFLYLAIQNTCCIAAILACKQMGLITNLAPFDNEKAKRCMFSKRQVDDVTN